MPAAMFASPWAQKCPYADGDPTNQPKSKGDNGKEEVRQVIDLNADKDLLVMAMRAVRSQTDFSHLG